MLKTTRVKTGITEFDEMLRGGFLQGDAVILAGSAGTGKTTLALQYLVNGINSFDENGIYVTFEQLPDQIYRDAENFGWNLRRLEEDGKFRLVCTSPDVLLEAGSQQVLDDFIREIQPRRIVIDSLSHLAMFVDERELRKEAYRIVMYLKTKGLSSMFIWETPQIIGQTFSVTDVGISFLVDAIVLMKSVELESSLRKALVILKMRGSDHDKGLREFEITSQGLKVGASFAEYEGIMTGSARKLTRMDEAVSRFSEAFTAKRKRS